VAGAGDGAVTATEQGSPRETKGPEPGPDLPLPPRQRSTLPEGPSEHYADLLRLERERTRRLSRQIEFEPVDIIVFEAGKDHRQEHSYILIETKKRGAPPTQKKDGVDQLKS
jgi:hypothetical protein